MCNEVCKLVIVIIVKYPTSKATTSASLTKHPIGCGKIKRCLLALIQKMGGEEEGGREREREREEMKGSTAVSDCDKQRALMVVDQTLSWEKYAPAE